MLLGRWGGSTDSGRAGSDVTGDGFDEPLQLMGGLAGAMLTPRSLLGGAGSVATDDSAAPSVAANAAVAPTIGGACCAAATAELSAASRSSVTTTPGSDDSIVTVAMLAIQLPLLEGQPSPPTVDFAIGVHDLLRDELGIEVRLLAPRSTSVERGLEVVGWQGYYFTQ